MNDRQKKVLGYIQQNQPVKLGDITKNFPQFTAATIRKDLQYLVNEFEKIGNNKGTVYKVKTEAFSLP